MGIIKICKVVNRFKLNVAVYSVKPSRKIRSTQTSGWKNVGVMEYIYYHHRCPRCLRGVIGGSALLRIPQCSLFMYSIQGS